MEFKIGDKILAVSVGYTIGISVGYIYTIKYIKGIYIEVEELPYPNMYLTKRFIRPTKLEIALYKD